jgi:hypothetical protein
MLSGIEKELGKLPLKKSANATGDVQKPMPISKSPKSHQLSAKDQLPKWHKNFCGMVFEKQQVN